MELSEDMQQYPESNAINSSQLRLDLKQQTSGLQNQNLTRPSDNG